MRVSNFAVVYVWDQGPLKGTIYQDHDAAPDAADKHFADMLQKTCDLLNEADNGKHIRVPGDECTHRADH